MMSLNIGHESDAALMVRAAWLYHMGGLTQEEVAGRLGVHRTRIVRLLGEARERGLVSITINHETIRDLALEQVIAERYGLDFCMLTPAIGLGADTSDPRLMAAQAMLARRAVGSAAASFLRGRIASGGCATVGVSWGRTLEQLAQHLNGIRNSDIRFVSLMGSLTRNSASNQFEVVQALAARTGGEGHFLPVPFIADSVADRAVLMSQRSVALALALAQTADLYLLSVGELSESAVLREQDMLSKEELRSVRAAGAVGDSLGRLFAADGTEVDHSLSRRTVAFDFQRLHGRDVVLLGAGLSKVAAIGALLSTGAIRGLIADGDTAAGVAKLAPPSGRTRHPAGAVRRERRTGTRPPR